MALGRSVTQGPRILGRESLYSISKRPIHRTFRQFAHRRIQLNLTSVLRYGDERKFELRRDQLEQRKFEIYAAIDALKKLSADGDRGNLSTIDDSKVDWSDFQGKIGFDALQLTGHSFGAATLLSLLSDEPTEGFAPLPVTHALLLDPWLEPFEKPGPVQASENAQVKKVILHSEEFTLWRDHMAQVVEVAKDWGNVPIYTIGTIYPVFISQMNILTPESRSPRNTPELLGLSCNLTQALHSEGSRTPSRDFRVVDCIP